jgi:hypothetical protein
MRLVLLKLNTGEEIIARVSDDLENENAIVVEAPRTLTVHQSPTGEMQVGMMPWILGNVDGTVRINTDHIVGTVTPIPEQLEKGYLSQTSKIELL